MALADNVTIILLFLVIVCEKSNGEMYKVGDSTGWTSMGHVDYKKWASTKTFRVGDKISFQYNKQFHNVVRVTHKNFDSCNAIDPLVTMTSGNDTFAIAIPGHYYFICSFPGHCEAGQKVDIRVLPTSSSPSPSPAITPVTPASPSEPTPSTSNSSSGAIKDSLKSKFGWSILMISFGCFWNWSLESVIVWIYL